MVTVKFDMSALNGAFEGMEKQVRFATSLAINRTALVVKEALKEEMQSVFDRPTSWTMNSLQMTPSTKQKLEAEVWFKDLSAWRKSNKSLVTGHYLEPQVYGGSRPFKGYEYLLQTNPHVSRSLPRGWFAVPGPAAHKDSYGNMSRGQIIQILSAMRAFSERGFIMNRRDKGMGGRSRNNLQFMVIQPGRGSKLKPGVWLRGPNHSVNQVLSFVPSVTYKQRFDFFGIAQRVVDWEMTKQFDKAMQDAVATAW